MKHLYLVLALTLAVAGVAAAESIHDESQFLPAFPTEAAEGFAQVAGGDSFSALFGNPAGYANTPPTITIADAALGTDFFPLPRSLSQAVDAWRDPSSSDHALSSLADSEGFGGNASFALGYTGGGLGVGVLGNSNIYASPNAGLDAANGVFTAEIVGGLGFEIEKGLTVGGSVRPLFRLRVSDAPIADLLSFLQSPFSGDSSLDALYGVGVGVDLGARYTAGPFSYGLSIRDLAGTRIFYAENALGTVMRSVSSGRGLPQGQEMSGVEYVIPMSIAAGVSYHPDLGALARDIDPRLEVDYQYIADASQSVLDETLGTFLANSFSAGLSLRLFSVATLRAGYLAPNAYAGVGLRAWFFEVDANVFHKVSNSADNAPRDGADLGVMLRF